MKKIEHIIDYIVDTFDCKNIPSCIPKNEYNFLKLDFYLFIKKYNLKLFIFLKKVYPIKYLNERADQSVWLHKRDSFNNRLMFEIEIKKIPPEATIYGIKDGIFKPDLHDNYQMRIFYNLVEVEQIKILFNKNTGIKSVNKHFSKFKEFNQILRGKKFKKILS